MTYECWSLNKKEEIQMMFWYMFRHIERRRDEEEMCYESRE